MAVLDVFTSGRAVLEATRGAGGTPTRLIYAESFDWTEVIQTIRPDERRGSYNPVYSSAAGPHRNSLAMSGRLSYELAAWLGNVYVAPLGTAAGGSGTYTYAFTPSGTADNVKSVAFQLGDAQAIGTATPGVSLTYLLGDSLTLHWEKNDDGGVTFDASLLAAGTATQITAFTGALSDYTTTSVSAADTTAYIDSSTIGSTADPNVISIDWTLNLNPVPLYTLNGSYGAKDVLRPDYRRWTATIVRQYSDDTEWDKYVSKGIRKVRIATTASATNSLTLDLYGTYTNRELADVDGIVTEVLTLDQQYDATATHDFKLTAVNSTIGTMT